MPFRHSKSSLILAFTLGLIVVAATIALYAISVARRQSQVISCNNHQRFLQWELGRYGENNHGTLPYADGAPGYIMLCRFSSSSPGLVNCNHGSPNTRIGGWQAVNLPPSRWFDVAARWKPSLVNTPIPFAWCGKPTGTGTRVVTAVTHCSPGEGITVHHFNMREQNLRECVSLLNTILGELGETPIALDVPDGVDWVEWDAQEIEGPQKAEGDG